MKLSKDKKTLYRINEKDIDDSGVFYVPDGVISIEEHATKNLSNLSRLKTIYLNDVEEIKKFAFYGSGIRKVIGSPRIIGKQAFAFCKKLGRIDLSRTVEIDAWAFANSGLTTVNISNIECVPTGLFSDCNELKTVIGFPKSISSNSFSGCVNLEELDLSGLECIETWAFHNSSFKGNVTESQKKVHIKRGDYEGNFARLSDCWPAYKISKVIDEEKNAYLDAWGYPFVIAPGNEIIYLTKDKDRFLSAWLT